MKRIQKHLIDRGDTMYFHSPVGSFYIDTFLDAIGRVVFKLTVWNGDQKESRCIGLVEDLHQDMKAISGDMRKWKVLKNGG